MADAVRALGALQAQHPDWPAVALADDLIRFLKPEAAAHRVMWERS